MLVAKRKPKTDKRAPQRSWDARRSHVSANIAPLPKVENRRRKSRCKNNLRKFLETYFPNCFQRKFSDDHLEVIERTQQAVLEGGFFAVAMPRGSGKTSIHQRAAIWAIVYGHASYVFIVCADSEKAKSALKNIKTEFEFNRMLFADFPEVCHPIRELQGVSQSARKQHINGVATLIDWTIGRAQMPTVKGSKASGSLIGVGGITGAARGAQITLPTGDVLRPSLLLVDDFQTRESAASPTQCKTRLDTLTGDLAGMRGPGVPLAILATMTVIYRDDAADKLLDREKYPEWHGTRKKLVYEWPAEEELWAKYRNLRRAAFQNDLPQTKANDFYRANQAAMDAGAVVAWPERFDDGELSAIQHAQNLRMIGEESFLAEYQNEPYVEKSDINMLAAGEAARKCNGYDGRLVPTECRHVTAMIDVQGSLLYWLVAAWQDDFTGYILDYGSFPEQSERHYSLSRARKTLQREFPGVSDEAAIFAGLQTLFASLLGSEWKREDGPTMRVSRCLVDANWGKTSELVNQACRQSPYAASITPSYGRGITATQMPISMWQQSMGVKCGPEWVPTKPKGNQMVGVIYDTWYWKTRWHNAFALPLGSAGCVSLFKSDPGLHQMFAEHACSSETPKKVASGGRTIVQWEEKPTHDNHLLDCAVGSMVAASMVGVSTAEYQPQKQAARIRMRRMRQH